MGPMSDIIGMMPGANKLKGLNVDEKKIIWIKKIELMIANFLKISSYREYWDRKKKDRNTMLKIKGVRLNTFRE